MRHALVVVAVVLAGAAPASAQFDWLLKGLKELGAGGQGDLGNDRVIAGLKQALEIGSQNAVNLTGRADGFFRNEAIKILMPEKLRTLERGLRAVGFGSQVDEFVLSLNRAAERATPFARQIFWDAIGEMSFDDARKILTGGQTAATEYFKAKTSGKLATAFRPVVEQATSEVGVTRQYKELLGRAQLLTMFSGEDFDIDHYVVAKGLDGLFHVLGEEERKIRTDPAARVTDLLREVFGR